MGPGKKQGKRVSPERRDEYKCGKLRNNACLPCWGQKGRYAVPAHVYTVCACVTDTRVCNMFGSCRAADGSAGRRPWVRETEELLGRFNLFSFCFFFALVCVAESGRAARWFDAIENCRPVGSTSLLYSVSEPWQTVQVRQSAASFSGHHRGARFLKTSDKVEEKKKKRKRRKTWKLLFWHLFFFLSCYIFLPFLRKSWPPLGSGFL